MNPARHLSVVRQSDNSSSMNLRHAAALALVGWYLMMPPLNPSSGIDSLSVWLNPDAQVLRRCDPEAPLSQWVEFKAYQEASECSRAQESTLEKAMKPDDDPWPDELTAFFQSRYPQLESFSKLGPLTQKELLRCPKFARCIATDDPRLKASWW